MVHLKIDGLPVEVPKGTTIMEAAKTIHINIPSLCFHEDQAIKAACRICVVEVDGRENLEPACSYPVAEGMEVKTHTPRILKARRNILELIFAHHPQDCLSCNKNGLCELQNVAAELNMNQPIRYDIEVRGKKVDDSSPSIVLDANKCIVCGRCLEACNEVQTVGAIAKENRGYETTVVPPYGKDLKDTACVNCGQCVQVCPTGALTVRDDTKMVEDAIQAGKVLVVQIAPSSRTTIAEALGEAPGVVSTGRMITALKMLGFDYVFDSDFTADLTIMEEGNELLHRIQNGGTLPMMTSCCPAWVKFIETFYPQKTHHLSTAKSPQQMFGSVIKTFFAQQNGIDPAKIFSCSIMPCTAKKFECKRPEMADSGYQDVDAAFTVQELARMIRAAGIDFEKLEDSPFDDPFGLGSGAGEIFAATGGVMEAALRTVYEVLTGSELKDLEFTAVRGIEGLKEATLDIAGTEVRVAVVHTLSEARKMMDRVVSGDANYHFIEVMACPGGCIGGGGNPIRSWKKVLERTAEVYQQDRDLPIRKSHESPAIKMIYDDFLGQPLSEKSHHLLHTTYINRQDLLR